MSDLWLPSDADRAFERDRLVSGFESKLEMDKAVADFRRNASPTAVLEHLPPLEGHWILDVWEGDVVKDDYGRVLNRKVAQLDGYNLVTTSGKGIILDRLYGLSAIGVVAKMGVGTSNTAAAVGNTSLTAVDYGPAAFDGTPVRSSLAVTSIQTWSTAQGNIAWAELGEFTAANGMLNRIAPIGPYTKDNTVSITVTLVLTQS